ncbi:glycosyltransferase family 1 protein [Flavobacterium sp. MAH-1]|uniref:Glycosyltransferase family 1 protein n=1 Tax=Flavobacterium agri TaxID=2743471 RepID=A0A7Y8Y290_9FLAO|nr:glycosyltransferase [Flavobacterium agri]NUY81222.1 glycosyltransferase family 1 protein [Flavobacterium agri]NYA71246.1 glycosyltransferase family 1 protein [Flavobacterium agri]
MRILLVGEFSRLHNSLKEGLVALGHEVTLVGSGDDFKNFPVDLSIASKTVARSSGLKFIGKITNKLLGFTLDSLEKGRRFEKLLPRLKGYDVVQLINSDAIETLPNLEIGLYDRLFAQNDKIFLLICGDETPVVNELLKNKQRYSVMTPYFEDKKLEPYYRYTLKYTSEKYRGLYRFVSQNASGLLTSDLDYKLVLDEAGIDTTLIPNPVNTDKIPFEELSVDRPITIFYGANKFSSVKKGGKFFEKALEIVKAKYSDKIKVETVNSLPYSEYVEHLKKAHIVLDQVYAFDQGYNALEAMARGKVVFTGAESEFYSHYGLSEKVAINALPDVDFIVSELSRLIENPSEIHEIGKRARAFIEKEHDYKSIAQRYLDFWQKS